MMRYQRFVSPETKFYDIPESVLLESGEVLSGVRVAYRTWGRFTGNNAILVCHALTGNADVDNWWGSLFGAGKTFDLENDFVICSNILGSCYGTTSPISVNPATGCPYGPDFPAITIRDMVRVQALLVKGLGVDRLKLVIGGSLGGMQVLEWAVMYPDVVEAIAPMAVSGRHSAWCIGLSEAQRQAVYADPYWRGGYYTIENPPAAGLGAARMMAMCMYRTKASFEAKFGRNLQSDKPSENLFAMQSYLHHHGEKLVERFDANCYITLTKAMDTHDLSRGRGEFEAVLGSIRQPTLMVAIDSDVLYLPEEQYELGNLIPNASLKILHSIHGHDAFLIDLETVNDMLVGFRKRLLSFDREKRLAEELMRNRFF